MLISKKNGSHLGWLTSPQCHDQDTEEMVSQFMELWMFEDWVLRDLSFDIKTNEPLSSLMIQKIKDRRRLAKTIELSHRLFLSQLELDLHSSFDPRGDRSMISLQRELSEKFYSKSIASMPSKGNIDALVQIFQSNAGGKHILQYRYLWSEIMSADAFEAFAAISKNHRNGNEECFEKLSKEGARFRECFLENGGSYSTHENFVKFRGREASPVPFLKTCGIQEIPCTKI